MAKMRWAGRGSWLRLTPIVAEDYYFGYWLTAKRISHNRKWPNRSYLTDLLYASRVTVDRRLCTGWGNIEIDKIGAKKKHKKNSKKKVSKKALAKNDWCQWRAPRLIQFKIQLKKKRPNANERNTFGKNIKDGKKKWKVFMDRSHSFNRISPKA